MSSSKRLKPLYPTSTCDPETKIQSSKWGADPAKGLLPFQVTLIPTSSTLTIKDMLNPNIRISDYDPLEPTKRQIYTKKQFNGLPKRKIKESTSKTLNQEELDTSTRGWGQDLYNYYFKPNPIETRVERRKAFKEHLVPERHVDSSTGLTMETGNYFSSHQPITNKRRVSAYSITKNGATRYTDHLAYIHFIYVDIDFQDIPRVEVDKLLHDYDFLKPQVKVMSGNGYHLYWGISPINLIALGSPLSKDRYSMVKRFADLKTKLALIFNGDMSVASNSTSLMRIPGTLNIKNKDGIKIKRCDYIYGSIPEAYSSPAFTIEVLEEMVNGVLGEDVPTSLQQQNKKNTPSVKRNRPYGDHEGWEDAFQKFNIYFDKRSYRKESREYRTRGAYYKYIFGYRKLNAFIELRDEKDKFIAGINRETLKKKRDLFLRYEVMQQVSPPNRKKKLCAKYCLTDLFYMASGLDLPVKSSISKYNLAELIKYCKSTQYPIGKRIPAQMREYGILKTAGASKQQIRDIQTDKLRESRREQHAYELIDWMESAWWK